MLQPTIALLLYACVRSADIAITASIVKNTLRAVVYGLVALFALVLIILLALGVK